MNPKILASAPAWLKKSLAEKIMTETDPVKIREAQMALETIKRSEQMVGGGLTPEQAGALLQNLHRQVSDPALPPLPSMRQQPLDYAKGGSVPETRSVVRLPQRQREMNRAMNIIASQRYSPSMTSGAPKTRGLDALTKGLIGAPMIGALTASPMSGMGRSAIAKLAKMLAGGSRNPGVVGAGAGINASTELLEDDPTLAGALTNAALGAADVAAPIPTLAGQVLGYSPDAEAGLLTKALQKYGARAARSEVDNMAETLPGQRGVIKQKGGNWLTGSVEKSLGGLKRDFGSIGRDGAPHPHAAALNSFIDKQLTNYVKNLMATPEDPVRALAERGVLHTTPYGAAIDPVSIEVRSKRENAKFPRGGLGQAELAKQWEVLSDKAVASEPASSYQNFGHSNMGEDWVNKLDPNTPFYRRDTATSNRGLGFGHLIDELGNAINPESGLPAHLQFPLERLGKVSVPQAVERVSQINAWRAAQKAEADMLRANNAATVLHKEYPEAGFKWVELKGRNPDEFEQSIGGLEPKAWDEAVKKFRTERESELADALKYEGDTMGHCVGGYCPDVLSGRSRIYSLRDAKGQPHVTVEVAPSRTLTPEKRENQLGHLVQRLMGEGKTLEEATREAVKLYPEAETYPSIVQIKGKQNRAPNPEYLPFVQDFVKSGQWSGVGDLQNTGLVHLPALNEAPETLDMLKSHFGDAKYVPASEIEEFIQSARQKFAKGGSVNSPGNRPLTQSDLHAMIAALEAQANA